MMFTPEHGSQPFDIVGWKYEADLHCQSCAEARFPGSLGPGGRTDREGNSVDPVFASHEFDFPPACGDCRTLL